jgi:hypothetical protein
MGRIRPTWSMRFVIVAARPLRRDPTPNSEIMTPSPLLFLALAALGGQDQPAPWFPKPAAPTPSAAPAAPTAPRAVATSLRLVDLALQDDRGYLGIYMEPTDRGLLVSGLMEGGAAEAAGIRAGDTITHVGAIKLSTPEGVEQLGKLKAGTKVLVKVLRGAGDREGVTDAVELRLQAGAEVGAPQEAPVVIEAAELIQPGDPSQPWIVADSAEEVERKTRKAEEILLRLEGQQQAEAEKLEALVERGSRRESRALRAIRERRAAREAEAVLEALPVAPDGPQELKVQVLVEGDGGEAETQDIVLSLEDLQLHAHGDDDGHHGEDHGDHGEDHGHHGDAEEHAIQYEVVIVEGDHAEDAHHGEVQIDRPRIRTWRGAAPRAGGGAVKIDALLHELPADLPEGARMRIRRALAEEMGDLEVEVDLLDVGIDARALEGKPRVIRRRVVRGEDGGEGRMWISALGEGGAVRLDGLRMMDFEEHHGDGHHGEEDCCGDCESSEECDSEECDSEDDCCGSDECHDHDDCCGSDECDDRGDCCGTCEEDECDEDDCCGDDHCSEGEDCHDEDDCCGDCEEQECPFLEHGDHRPQVMFLNRALPFGTHGGDPVMMLHGALPGRGGPLMGMRGMRGAMPLRGRMGMGGQPQGRWMQRSPMGGRNMPHGPHGQGQPHQGHPMEGHSFQGHGPDRGPDRGPGPDELRMLLDELRGLREEIGALRHEVEALRRGDEGERRPERDGGRDRGGNGRQDRRRNRR